jgi:ribosomal protein S18 acetylase RimI-like enzyme
LSAAPGRPKRARAAARSAEASASAWLSGPLARKLCLQGRSVRLHAARRKDVAAVVALGAQAERAEHALIPDIASPRQDRRAARRYWRRAIGSARTRLFVATCRQEVLALIGVDLIVSRHRLARVRRRVYVHSLFVRADARRLGLGVRLTRLALDWGRGRGATQARLEMAAPNRSARLLYEAAGFRLREMMFARPL